jgi:hypothetical protein
MLTPTQNDAFLKPGFKVPVSESLRMEVDSLTRVDARVPELKPPGLEMRSC